MGIGCNMHSSQIATLSSVEGLLVCPKDDWRPTDDSYHHQRVPDRPLENPLVHQRSTSWCIWRPVGFLMAEIAVACDLSNKWLAGCCR